MGPGVVSDSGLLEIYYVIEFVTKHIKPGLPLRLGPGAEIPAHTLSLGFWLHFVNDTKPSLFILITLSYSQFSFYFSFSHCSCRVSRKYYNDVYCLVYSNSSVCFH